MPSEDRDRNAEADAFEREVRRVAELLYPGDPLSGAAIVDDMERDCVLTTEDTVVVVEATISAQKEKAEKDGRKLKALTDKLAREYPYRAIKGFFVTRSDPTAHQLDVIRRIGPPVVAISYAKFRARLIDARSYLEARADHAFGSARDPETDDIRVGDKYIALDFVDEFDRRRRYDFEALVNGIADGRRMVLLGDFGAGKSMTLRELHMRFRRNMLRSDDAKFCIHLNLNDHQGQTDPSEALIRHANLIGFPYPHQLVRAWRASDASILLDGFDELFVPGWASGSRPLAEVRRKSVELARRFVQSTPPDSAIVVAGRENFFDNLSELTSALGLPKNAVVASTSDFTEDQVAEYLRNRRWTTPLPLWLPRRPLLIGYLASRRFLDIVEDLEVVDAGEGWNLLLAAVCDREQTADGGVDATTVRGIIERLATLARKTTSGLGPLDFDDLVTVFRDLRGYLPDEGAYSVLQRLPGLRVNDAQRNSRLFVDDDLVDAARAGDVYHWIIRPDTADLSEAFHGWSTLLGNIGLAVVRARLGEGTFDPRQIQAALVRLQGATGTGGLQADLLRLLLAEGIKPTKPVVLSDIHFPSLSIGGGCDASEVTLEGCIIDVLDVSEVDSVESLPLLRDCWVNVVEGAAGFDKLAESKFIGTEFGAFSGSTQNMTAILRLDLPDYTRVALTLLRKIFVQSGHSRKESALYRGSLTMKQRSLVPKVLDDLQSKGAIRRYSRRDKVLWEPNRAMHRRVRDILDAPTSSTDFLISEHV